VRKDTDPFPAPIRRQIERGVAILRGQFAEAIKGKDWERGKQGRILKIVLYGSMARGQPVRDLGTGYRSDFDLLVIVSHPELTDEDWWYGASDALTFEASLGATRYPYNFIVHDLADVNDQLRRGRPFFVDILRDGVILYEYDSKELARPGNLTPEEVQAEARGYFEQWYASSLEFSELAAVAIEKGMTNKAAFLLHQAVESAYHCLLLTLTLYAPKLHNIEKLRGMAEGVAPELIEAWPRKHRWERRPFNLLVRAYVEARYSATYTITAEDLASAAEQVAKLQDLVTKVYHRRSSAC
jgi:HEPN domain-containing protein/predicted nucleotidyltransferase